MREMVRKRLRAFNVTIAPAEEWTLDFIISKVQTEICNLCNQKELPESLNSVAVDMAAGEFLLLRKASSPEKIKDIDLSPAIKQIQEGDTSVTYADGAKSPEQRLDAVINFLLNNGREQIVKHRRLVF